MIRRSFAGVLAGCLLLLVAACSDSEGTNPNGYISGDGQVVYYAVDGREAPIELTGETLDGDPVDLADYRGEVVVMNSWGAWCADCHAEMPDLVEAADELGDRASFLGLNLRDPSRETALAFERDYGVEYPSVDASTDPRVLLAFSGVFNPRSTPTTVVLDTEGRVAAIISGRIPSSLTLVQVVEDVIAGKVPVQDG